MIINMLRSSSLSQYVDFCEQQYYINYVLGHDSPPNLKADCGSISHLVLEWIAMLKLQYDERRETLSLKTGAIDFEFHRDKLYEVTTLSDEDVKKINKSRINKQIYLPSAQMLPGQERYGSFVVNTLINAAYKYFSEVVTPTHNWTKATYKQVWNCTWMTLEQFNRVYDPRFSKIISPEKKFEFDIEKDWAKYEYFLHGKKINGYLKLKGTIDLVVEVDENTIEIRDYKYGRMFNWGQNKPKDYESLQKDKQLMFYYYAAKKIFPQYENIMITIIFVRDGGPVTVCFDDSDYNEVESMVKETFLKVKNNEEPRLLDPTYRDHRCNKFCAFYKKQVDGKPLCAYIKDSIDTYGIQHTTDAEMVKGFTPGFYSAPGE